jgi:hypothetical protein
MAWLRLIPAGCCPHPLQHVAYLQGYAVFIDVCYVRQSVQEREEFCSFFRIFLWILLQSLTFSSSCLPSSTHRLRRCRALQARPGQGSLVSCPLCSGLLLGTQLFIVLHARHWLYPGPQRQLAGLHMAQYRRVIQTTHSVDRTLGTSLMGWSTSPCRSCLMLCCPASLTSGRWWSPG